MLGTTRASTIIVNDDLWRANERISSLEELCCLTAPRRDVTIESLLVKRPTLSPRPGLKLGALGALGAQGKTTRTLGGLGGCIPGLPAR